LKRYILSISLAVILVVAAFLFFRTYGRFQRLHAGLVQADRDLRVLSRQQKEMEAKVRILAREKSFVQKAQALGLVKERWDTYEVELKEPVSFPEAREILAQTGNAGSYYFIPVYLHMSTDLSRMEGGSGAEKRPQGNNASGPKKGDVLMDLKGTFLVRAR